MENVAFRGFSSLIPENTKTAILRAADLGSHRIRCEVRSSRDGQFFLFSDPSLHRVTGTHGWFHRMDAQEIARRPVPFSPRSSGAERILSLGELLPLARERGLALQLELPRGSGPRWKKAAPLEARGLRDFLSREAGGLDLQILSRDAAILRDILEASPWPVGFLAERFPEAEKWLEEARSGERILYLSRDLFFAPYRKRDLRSLRQGCLDLIDRANQVAMRVYVGPLSSGRELELLSQLPLAGLCTPAPAQLASLGIRRGT
ncbi:MAG: glycerophosphodiester phosphodiesterase family protein [Candidatus Krumholzibacteria bacterium]|jgi:glycerophosphoryl diester phosphodiesterase|nr:glycerophosphodiester phosphodiesterase family protein [Candidatus Krumholzibacteria bacterium]MDP6669688.1 glycerophosphodiester phosphodiesterase family protein [Candidatus Krumholzibacteria bacterium]MDP6796570.1 glycerophosphodiester phosphodiesterase family protein [Candidatus Krumholzibacteria bacterium]MDP7021460.1 glycerophosphodiester phosphodiesterase family protein [Candidatus Krumholzibacteria bacterium]